MPDRHSTIWPLLPHTAAKHSILRRHLEAWFPKLSWAGRVRVIDGFAGPGEYTHGEPGSPIIALNVALTHRANLSNCRIEFVFVEEDRDRFLDLEQRISEVGVAAHISVETRLGSFKDVLGNALTEADRSRRSLPPSFVMIDPFGFEGVPMAMIERIARQPRSEVLISFMYDSVTRWLGDARNASNFDELFGCMEWRSALTMTDSSERRGFLLQLYVNQLQSHGWRYVRTSEMRDEDDRTEYFLVFGTNHLDGMKEAMWKIDPSGRYVFSDATDRRQMTLFALEPDYSQLRRLILQRFHGGRPVRIEDLEDFVLIETAFRETHIRAPILVPLERTRGLEVLRSPRTRRMAYPTGTVLRFLVDP